MSSFAPQHCPFSVTETTVTCGFLDILPIFTKFHNKMRTTHSGKAATLQVTVLKLPAIPNPNRVKTNQDDIMQIGLPNLMGVIKTATGKRLACQSKSIMGYGKYAGQSTSVSLAVRVSIPRSLLLPILFFFGRGIDTMFPALPLSLPTTFPKLFTHTTRMGWSLYPSRSIMSETG